MRESPVKWVSWGELIYMVLGIIAMFGTIVTYIVWMAKFDKHPFEEGFWWFLAFLAQIVAALIFFWLANAFRGKA